MSNNTFKIQPSKTPLDASFLYEPDKGPDQSFLNLNLQPSMSQQSFHGNSSPPPQTPQNLNASFYPLKCPFTNSCNGTYSKSENTYG